jgi:diguanylate cyclase (GGDEF)-like protein
LRKLIDLGVPEGMAPEEAKYIQMSNLGSLLMIVVNTPYLALSIASGWTFVTIELVILDALLFLTAFINSRGFHTAALFYFGTLLNLHLVFVTVAMSRETLLPLLIFFTAGGAITLMRRGRTPILLAALAGILGMYLAALALEGAIGPLYSLQAGQRSLLRLLVEYSIFGLIVVNALIGRFGAISAEDRLREEKKRSEGLLSRVQEQDRQKTLFFQNISHELRTPLTIIAGPLEDLLADDAGSLGRANRGKLELVARNAGRLRRLIDQLLDLARIDAGHLGLRPARADMARHLTGIVQSFAGFAERKGIRLSFHPNPGPGMDVYDPEIVEKVVSNLLSNACKHTPAGGEVSVSLSRLPGQTLITVTDSGVGIPAGEQERIFERFYQVDGSRTRAGEGTGIGLSLVKELVQIHGGDIRVTSAIGQGSRFVVSLPRGEVTAETEQGGGTKESVHVRLESESLASLLPSAEPAVHAAAGAPLILLVEDNAEMRAFIHRGLEAHYRVVEAVDGGDGLAKAREHLPHLVISDVMMPGMDGYELCKALREEPRCSLIPVILLTALASREPVLKGLDCGAVDFISKPFSFDVLLAKIRNLLRRDAEHDEHALRDGLTGLLTRAAWEMEAERALSLLARRGGAASLAFLDIDDFKLVNDTHGHPAGDLVLKELAVTIAGQVRGSDLAGRYGGEEIVLLLTDSSGESALKSVERILAIFRGRRVVPEGCTFSAGVAEISGSATQPLSTYISRADQAMYQSKLAGKARVSAWRGG